QKTAWFMLHRVRLAMQDIEGGTIGGDVEVDETFIGGKARNMHKSKKRRVIGANTGVTGKIAVMGLLDRHSERGHSTMRVRTVPTHRPKDVMQSEVRCIVDAGANVYTDAHSSYTGLNAEYIHGVIDHA